MTAAVFVVQTEQSAVLIEARSSVGPIELATTEVTGTAEVELAGDGLSILSAELELPVTSLMSGRQLYDTEVHRRLDAQRYPVIRAQMRSAVPLNGARWSLDGDLTIHGTMRTMSGTGELVRDDDALELTGEHVVDIRDFGISLPSALMLRIFPDVTVRFRIRAVAAEQV